LISSEPVPFALSLSKGRALFAQLCKAIFSRKTREKRKWAEQPETKLFSVFLRIWRCSRLIEIA